MKSIERGSVLEALQERAPRALHIAELCSRLDVNKRRIQDVQDVLDALVASGDVTEMPGRRFRITKKKKARPAPSASAMAPRGGFAAPTIERGRLQRNPRGFGFVAPESRTEDIFIPPDSMGAAMHGDRVEVSARPSKKGREGRVVAVLERGSPRFSATLKRNGKHAWLEPDDLRLPAVVEVLNVQDDADGLAVLAEFIRFPQGDDDTPSAEIVGVIGVQGMTTVEVAKIKIREGVIEEFSAASLAEAALLPDKVPEADLAAREDLRHLDLTTIDPADARDHDDALYCERVGDGYRLIVAIADVSHYVIEGTAIDEDAISKMTSIYLPDRAIPMLPKEISSGLASLVPDQDRLCLAVEVELGPNGAIKGHRVMEACMRSRARLTYEGVAHALGLTDEGPDQPEAKKRVEGLSILYELSKTLRRRRLRRGALDFDLPEPKVILDVHNVEPIDVRRSRKDPGVREAYRIVEEMMLLANEVVAAELKKREVPAIHRIHAPPDEKKIERFAKLAGALAYDITTESARDPKQLSRFLTKIEGTEHANVLRYLLLRSMQQAQYDTDGDVGHFGLAARDYLHFTSPIRRYPDLVVHRIVKAVLRKQPIDGATLMPRLRRFSAEASRLERRAITVERDVIDLYRAILLRDRVGDEFEAEISAITDFGFYVRFDEPFAEALVPIERLDNDYYEVGDLGIRLVGARSGASYALGDRIKVRLEDVSVAKRELIAVPVGFPPRTEMREPRGRSRGAPKSRGGDKKSADKRGGDKKGAGSAERPRRTRRKKTDESSTRGKSDGRPSRTKEDKRAKPQDSDKKPRRKRRGK